MPTRQTFRFAGLAMLPIAIVLPQPGAHAQVLNTRPLSEPFVNPNNPNAGPLGSRTAPGWRDTAPGQQVNQRQPPPPAPLRATCWTDNQGHRRCQAVR